MAEEAPSQKPPGPRALTEADVQKESRIDVPSAEHERRFGIRRVDWARIKRSIEKVKKPLPALSFFYSSLVGVAVSAGLTIIPLATSQGLPAWVVPFYVCITIFSGAVAWILYHFEQKFIARQKEDAGDILEDMHEIEDVAHPGK